MNFLFSIAPNTTASIYVEENKDILNLVQKAIELNFTQLTDIFAADYPMNDRRFEIFYSLLDIQDNRRIVFKTCTEKYIPSLLSIRKSCAAEALPSLLLILECSKWYEREICDMFGVEFIGNDDRRRLLSEEGFIGHPLRKDFPLSGYSQVRYDLQSAQVVHEPLELTQEYRHFDTITPWTGAEYPYNKDREDDA